MPDLAIRAPSEAELPRLFEYLGELSAENGRDGTALFDPRSRSAPAREIAREERFAAGLGVPVGEPGWRRVWIAFDASGTPAGHVDLRAPEAPSTGHGTLLGLGVARRHRRRGLAARLVEHALAWARGETSLAWIDLEYLGTNEVAGRLYRRLGFREVARVDDMFRIDGESVASVLMTLRVR